jgi:uncharacterized protein YdeI (YjbR/CyaY-like superfamily)
MPKVPAPDLPQLKVRTRAEWRRWLERNHASAPGVWFVFYKAHTGRVGVRYDEAVEEALCFGWIDSVSHHLDDDRYLQKFTPRRPGSQWSESNLERVRRLEAGGLMTPAGRAHFAGAKSRPALGPTVSAAVPAELKQELAKNPRAAARFAALPPGYVRTSMRWINGAKRADTRGRRIAEFVAVTARGERIGLR